MHFAKICQIEFQTCVFHRRRCVASSSSSASSASSSSYTLLQCPRLLPFRTLWVSSRTKGGRDECSWRSSLGESFTTQINISLGLHVPLFVHKLSRRQRRRSRSRRRTTARQTRPEWHARDVDGPGKDLVFYECHLHTRNFVFSSAVWESCVRESRPPAHVFVCQLVRVNGNANGHA